MLRRLRGGPERSSGHGGGSGGRWLVSYADFVTLMFGFFLILWASANQDEAVFDNPDEVKLDRWPNRHQGFGLGAHRCLGSNLGRVQFQEVLTTTLRRLPDLKADVGAAQRYPSLGQVNGYATLPATFTPVEPVGARLPE